MAFADNEVGCFILEEWLFALLSTKYSCKLGYSWLKKLCCAEQLPKNSFVRGSFYGCHASHGKIRRIGCVIR